jgi:hypothetical protein
MTNQDEKHFCAKGDGMSASELQVLSDQYKIERELLQNELVMLRTENEIYKQTLEWTRDELVIVRARLENEMAKNREVAAQFDPSDKRQSRLRASDGQQSVDNSDGIVCAKPITSEEESRNRFPGSKRQESAASDGSIGLTNTMTNQFVPLLSRFWEKECQCVAWDVLQNVRGVIGFLCSSETLRIKDATEKACETWGSSKLWEQPFHSLLSVMEGSHTLKSAFDQINQCNGAQTITLGCVEMKTRSGRADFALNAVKLQNERYPYDSYVIILGEKLKSADFRYKRRTTASCG